MTDSWEQRLSRAQSRYEQARTERDQLIRDAAAAGFGKTAIVRVTGIPRATVYRILRRESASE